MQVVVDLNTETFSEVSGRDAFALQLRGTHVIANTKPQWAYQYALDVLHKPWPPGEAAIAKSASQSYMYARYVLKSRFYLGEPAILRDTDWTREYQGYFNLILDNGKFQSC